MNELLLDIIRKNGLLWTVNSGLDSDVNNMKNFVRDLIHESSEFIEQHGISDIRYIDNLRKHFGVD